MADASASEHDGIRKVPSLALSALLVGSRSAPRADAPCSPRRARPLTRTGTLSAQVIEREMFRLRSTYGPEAVPVSSSTALAPLRAGALRGKVVLVTGGTKGLGREFACRAAAEGGARVVLGARGEDGVREVVREIEAAGGCASRFSPSALYAALTLCENGCSARRRAWRRT